jgi:hypothetical protein
MKLIRAVLALALLSVAAHAEAIDIPLTVTNRSGVARTAEPVTTGVPFAQGVVPDVVPLPLRVLVDGVEIPAQFTRTARWPDGSVRWVLADFQVNLPASGSRQVVLRTGVPSRQPALPIVTTDSPTAIIVDTGADRVVLAKTHFALRGAAFDVDANGGTYRAVPHTWVVEEAGPLKAVVRIDGVWRNGSAPLRNDLNRFRARLVFHQGKPDVRLFLTFRNNNSFGYDPHGGGAPRQGDLEVGRVAFGAAVLLPASRIHRFGSGVEKTWELTVPLTGPPAVVNTRHSSSGAVIAGDESPRPMAAAPPAYYASTRAWGQIGLPVTGMPRDRQDDFDRFERLQRAKVDVAAVENPPGLTGMTVWGHLSRDLDRWNDYGDLRWAGNGCGDLSGNHYDWVFGMYLQFMRTGHLPFADLARVLARHEIDFDIYHTGADGPAFNYQKNWEDRPSHDSPDNCFGGGRPSHTWSQGYALHWLLTGDRRGKDAFDEIQEGVRQYLYESFSGEGRVDTDEIRVQGWIVENLTNRWRIDPDATLATQRYGHKTIQEAIRDVLRGVFALEASTGRRGRIPADSDAQAVQPLQLLYFLEPAMVAADEVFATGDPAYRQELLGLVTRMTDFLMSITYGGDFDRRDRYRPLQLPYRFTAGRTFETSGELPYLLPAANAAGFVFSITGEQKYRDYARSAFRDYVRYAGAIEPDRYGDPKARTATAYNSNIFVGTESKIHGWSSRYGQHFLASESIRPAGSQPAR